MSKKITNEQAKQAEQNKEKRKKIDYRKFANQLFKNPTDHLPLITGGIGPGKRHYCYDCKSTTPKVTIKNDGTIVCDSCGSTFVEMREKNPNWWKRLCWKMKQIQYTIHKTYEHRKEI